MRSWDTWGDDPIDGLQAFVDDDRAMTQTLRVSPHDHLAEMVVTAAGRFGRRFRTIAWTAPDMAPSRSSTVVPMRDRINSRDYQIDPGLVANAIVDRVCAGHRTPTLH
jgi:hypothetical protein